MAARHPELADYLSRHAVQRGWFTLASGERSPYYIDGRIVSHDAAGLVVLAGAIDQQLEQMGAHEGEERVEAVGGLALGATPIVGGYLCYRGMRGRPLTGFTVRKTVKEHGTQRQVEGPDLPPGTRVALLEDVVTSGGSILQAADAAERRGWRITAAVAMVDREAGAERKLAQRKIPYCPLVTLDDLGLRTPEDSE